MTIMENNIRKQKENKVEMSESRHVRLFAKMSGFFAQLSYISRCFRFFGQPMLACSTIGSHSPGSSGRKKSGKNEDLVMKLVKKVEKIQI